MRCDFSEGDAMESPKALERNETARCDYSQRGKDNTLHLQLYRPAHERLSRSVNRHGRCAERLMPMRLSATTSKVARGLETKQWRGSEHKSISW